MSVKPIPDGYPVLSPNLAVDGASDAIEFYKTVLGATERMRFESPDGRIGHAELQIGDSVLMVADEYPDMDFIGPLKVGGTSMILSVFVEDVDVTFKAAIDAGAKEVRSVEDQFYGDRSGTFDDPFGHRWNVATHIEDLSPDEMRQRGADAMGNESG